MTTLKIFILLAAALATGKNHDANNINQSEYLTYCSTEKRELCKWTISISIAREAARLHQIEYKEHHIELWERKMETPFSIHLRRTIKITKLNPGIFTGSKIRHF